MLSNSSAQLLLHSPRVQPDCCLDAAKPLYLRICHVMDGGDAAVLDAQLLVDHLQVQVQVAVSIQSEASEVCLFNAVHCMASSKDPRVSAPAPCGLERCGLEEIGRQY